MPRLDLEGTSLYHETVGQGPVLLCISGGDGSVEIWQKFAQALKDHFTVISYDRRGFSRSFLTGAQDYANRFKTDIADAATLLKQYSPSTPATVIGNSSGALVALGLLSAHPGLIKHLVSYEAPAAALLPDHANIKAEHDTIYATYRAAGPLPAMMHFGKMTQFNIANTPPEVQGFLADFAAPFRFSNIQYWIEREFMTYPFEPIDVKGALAPVKHKLLLVNGEETPKTPYQYRANVAIADELELELDFFPGEHFAHASHPEEAARRLRSILARRGLQETDTEGPY